MSRAPSPEEKERRLSEYLARVVDECPPLTPEQRDRIGSILAKSRRIDPAGGSALDRMMKEWPL